MPEKPQPMQKPRRKRRWLRRIFLSLLTLLLLLVLFHRPIIHYGGRWAAIYFARQAHLNLDLKIAGNIWSRLEILNVKATSDGSPDAPLESLSLDKVAVDYDILKLIKADLTGLKSVEVGTVVAVVPELPEKPKEEKPSPPLAETLRGLLAKPLPAPGVSIQRVDIRVKGKQDIVVENFRLHLHAGKDGKAGWDKLEVPGAPKIAPFDAVTRFESGKLDIQQSGERPFLLSLQVEPKSAAEPGKIGLVTKVFGAEVQVSVAPATVGNNLDASVQLANLDVQSVTQPLEIQTPVRAQVPKIAVTFTGDPEKPATWAAEVSLNAKGESLGGPENEPDYVKGATADVLLSLKDQTLEIRKLDATAAGVSLRGGGAVPIPPALLAGGGLPALEKGELQLTINAPALAETARLFKQEAGGTLTAAAKLTIDRATVRLNLEANGETISYGPAGIAKLALHIAGSQSVRDLQSLSLLEATANLNAERAGTKEFLADTVTLGAEFSGLRAVVKELRVARGASSIVASATAALNEEGALASAPTAKFSLNIPSVADYELAVNGKRVAGAITGEGQVILGNPVENTSGSVILKGSALKIGGAEAGSFDVDVSAANGTATIKNIGAALAGGTSLQIQGTAGLSGKYPYKANVALKAPDLAAFQRLLAELGIQQTIRGSLNLEVEGSGDIEKPSGIIRLAADKATFGETVVDEARIAAAVTPESAETSELRVIMGKLAASAALAWKDKRVTLSGLDLRMDKLPVLTGSLSAPLDPASKTPLNPDEPISAVISAKDLDIAQLLAALGQKPKARGIINMNLSAAGKLADPTIKLTLAGTKLEAVEPPPPAPAKRSTVVQPRPSGEKAPSAQSLAPAELDTTLSFASNKLEIKGTVRQPLIQPLTFSANSTINLQSILEGRPLDVNALPVAAKLDLPASDISFLPRMVTALAKLEGTASISATVAGTAAKPDITGNVGINIKQARLSNGALPLITNFNSRINYANQRVNFTEFAGELGGGKFGLSGNIGLTKPAEPQFDLAFKSNEVLVVRDDSVLVRLNTDLALKGPLNAASATGTINIVQSRVNKEIDILPLQLPGKPKPVPKAVAAPPQISFPDPPLRDWKFDIAIKTTPEDPFLIRGNLAKGRVTTDLRLQGTGLHPYLSGAATIEQFSANLPLSKLTTRRGVVTFSERDPFVPFVELEAESQVRQYVIVVRVNGPASKPELDLTSEPPLPQEEILSLLTTGSLTGEIGANANALATRAAILVVKSWYRKLFKRGFPDAEDDGGESILDRFEVEFGAVDPKTGRSETTAQVRLTDRLFLVGDLEFDGGYSGRVKYLLRFR